MSDLRRGFVARRIFEITNFPKLAQSQLGGLRRQPTIVGTELGECRKPPVSAVSFLAENYRGLRLCTWQAPGAIVCIRVRCVRVVFILPGISYPTALSARHFLFSAHPDSSS